MPVFDITSPDGQKYRVTAPEGATEQQALDRVKAEHQNAPAGTPGGDAGGSVPSPPQTPTVADRGAFQPGAEHLEPGQLSNVQTAEAAPPGEVEPHVLSQRAGLVSRATPADRDFQSKQENLPGGRQAIYDMLSNQGERAKFLQQHYGRDSVGQDSNGLYVRLPSGRKMYPTGTGMKGAASEVAANALPFAGATAGALGAGAISAPSGPGAFAAAAGGSGLGAAAGQGANDAIVKALGYYDRTMGEEAAGLGEAAAGGAAGEVIGRAGPELIGAGLRGAQRFLADSPEKVAAARELAAKGFRVNPGSYLDSKYLPRVVELAKRTANYDPLAVDAARFGRDETKGMLERAGRTPGEAAEETGRLSVSKPSLEPAGEALRSAAETDYAKQEAELNRQIEEIRANAQREGMAPVQQLERDKATAQTVMTKRNAQVEATIQDGFRDLNMQRARARPGALSQDTATAIQNVRQQVVDRANSMYEPAIAMGGTHPIDVSPAKDAVEAFMAEIPDDLKRNSPSLMQSMEKMLNSQDGAPTLDLGQLQRLRSQLRDLGFSKSLTPDFKRGPYNMLGKVVDDIMHAPGNDPQVKSAVKLIDKADKFYGKNMKQFQSQELQALSDDVRAGLPSDARRIADLAAEPGQAATLKRIQKIGGPELTQRIASADLDNILRESSHVGGRVDPKAFYSQIKDRWQSKMLQAVHGDTNAARIELLARRLAAKDGTLPLKDLTPDNFVRQLTLANQAADVAKQLASKDPVKLLQDATSGGEKAVRDATSGFSARMSGGQDILSFLREPTLLANQAASRILSNEQLMAEAVRRYGEDSPAITTLRQKALERMLAPVLQGEGADSLGRGLTELSEKQQKLLFPNGMDDDLRKIATGLKMITGEGTGSMPGMAAGAVLGKPIAQRLPLQYRYKLETWLVTHPQFVKAIAADYGPTGPTARGLQKLRAVLAHIGRAGTELTGASTPENEGTPEGQANMPPMDQPAARRGGPGWRGYAAPNGSTDSWRQYAQ